MTLSITYNNIFNPLVLTTMMPPESTLSLVEDPIAVSCVMHRLRTTNESLADAARPNYVFSINNDAEKLVKMITSEDRLMAHNIRLFYNGKIVLNRLRNQTLSPFRSDLVTLLLMDRDEYGKYNIPESYAGMLYKLPYFYTYDRMLIDKVFQGEYASINGPIRRNLTFICKLDPDRKQRIAQYEYWFTDEANNKVALCIAKNNPLRGLFEDYIKHNTVRIDGQLLSKRVDNLEFYVSSLKWNLAV